MKSIKFITWHIGFSAWHPSSGSAKTVEWDTLHHQCSPTSTTSSEENGPCCLCFIWSCRPWRKPERWPIRCWSKYLSSIKYRQQVRAFDIPFNFRSHKDAAALGNLSTNQQIGLILRLSIFAFSSTSVWPTLLNGNVEFESSLGDWTLQHL